MQINWAGLLRCLKLGVCSCILLNKILTLQFIDFKAFLFNHWVFFSFCAVFSWSCQIPFFNWPPIVNNNRFLFSLMCDILSVILLHYHFVSLIYVYYTKSTRWEIRNFLDFTRGGTELSTKLTFCAIAPLQWSHENSERDGWKQPEMKKTRCSIVSSGVLIVLYKWVK